MLVKGLSGQYSRLSVGTQGQQELTTNQDKLSQQTLLLLRIVPCTS